MIGISKPRFEDGAIHDPHGDFFGDYRVYEGDIQFRFHTMRCDHKKFSLVGQQAWFKIAIPPDAYITIYQTYKFCKR